MKLNNKTFLTTIYFIVVAFSVAYFFPKEGSFRYQFYEGKPWRYGLLTAPNDFPIFKTDKVVQQERDSALLKYAPYFRYKEEIANKQIALLREAYHKELHKHATPQDMQYIERQMLYIYKVGIVLKEELDMLKDQKYDRLFLLKNNTASEVPPSTLFTIRTAYEFIINNSTASLSKAELRSCNINEYLMENVHFDISMSERVKDDILSSVPLYNGMVQAGERIVDKGEIVSAHTYSVLRSLKTVVEKDSGGEQRYYITLFGQFILVFVLFACLWLYLWSFRKVYFYNDKHIKFLLFSMFVAIFCTELIVIYGLFNIYILPFAIIPIVVRIFLDSRTALFAHLITVLTCSLMAPFPHEFLLIQAVSGMIVIFSLRQMTERSQLIQTAFLVFLSHIFVYFSLVLYQEADFNKINWSMLLYFCINFILTMFSYVLVYMLEKTFGYVSDITLVELSNINNPLLKRLSETCPGTFQHSLQVSILATEAAIKMDANPQLIRTGALYHDIGKMNNPAFFTENQGGKNNHDSLTFEESAQVIIAHVTDGIKLAEKEHLPKQIIDFIKTHHGESKVRYFYNSFKNKYPDKEINEALFTYPGPKPFSKETAILMMADSVEAASRSLPEYTEESIQKLVNKIIDSQMDEGMFQNSPLTFKDVETIKAVFVDKLKIMYHTRISYPELNK